MSCAFRPSRVLRRVSNSLALAADDAADFRIVLARQQVGGKTTLSSPSSSASSRARRAVEFVQPLGDDREVGAGLGVVEPDDDVAGLHLIAVAHVQLGDDAAGRVLHLLDVGIDDELALRDHRAGEFAGRGPAADAADQQARSPTSADEKMAPDRLAARS